MHSLFSIRFTGKLLIETFILTTTLIHVIEEIGNIRLELELAKVVRNLTKIYFNSLRDRLQNSLCYYKQIKVNN